MNFNFNKILAFNQETDVGKYAVYLTGSPILALFYASVKVCDKLPF